MDTPRITVDDVALAVHDRPGEGRPVVLVHGWCCDHTYLEPQADHLSARGHRVVSLDLRGHGDSDVSDGSYTMERFALDVLGVIDTLELDAPVVVGHSMGGVIATVLGGRFADRVGGVVGLDPGLAIDPGTLAATRRGAELMADDVRGVQRRLIEGALFLDSDDPAVRARVVDEMTSAPEHVAVQAFAGLAAVDPVALVEAIAVPAMMIWADRNDADVAEHTARFPHVTWRETPGVGHFHHLLDPPAVNALLDEFLDGLA